ncbi:MAG: diacylglycerol/polyprenol kinase family protein [Candidatus Heimdallarchaeota archaeon]
MDRFIIDLILLPLSYLYIAILLKMASIWKKSGRMSGSTSRKFVHVSTGLIVIAMPIIFSTKIVPVFIAFTFILLNFLTSPASPFEKMKLDSISDGHSLGTTYYAISLTLLLWFYFDIPWILQVGFLPLVIGDASAAYFGLKFGKHKWKFFKDKSIEGSGAGFLATFMILTFVLSAYRFIDLFDFELSFMFGMVFTISIITLIIELISPKGFDNLTIPLFCTMFALYIS